MGGSVYGAKRREKREENGSEGRGERSERRTENVFPTLAHDKLILINERIRVKIRHIKAHYLW